MPIGSLKSSYFKVAGLCALAVLIGVPVVHAGVSFSADFLWNPDSNNETQVYLHIANAAYNPPRQEVEQVYPMIDNPESDYPVCLFMASTAHVSLTRVWTLRAKGMPWVVVMAKLGIPRDRIFVASSRDPGPPYGRAYGAWKKNHHDDSALLIKDDDVRYWVNVQTMARYFHTPASTVQDWRAHGHTWKTIARDEYKSHGRGHGKPDSAGMAGPGHSGNPGHGHGHGKGKKKGD